MTNGPLLSDGSKRNMNVLAEHIQRKRQNKPILLMAHQILGYPDFETNYEMIRLFHECGVDLVELQIPFTEPIADGPVFLKANQQSLERGTTVEQCMEFARRVAADFDMPFLFMTYFNIVYQYGIERFTEDCASIGISGLIVPDAYPEESEDYLRSCRDHGIAPILLATPYTSNERLSYVANETDGFLYCVARKGLTGSKTEFDDATSVFLARCRQYAQTPIGVGFGIQHPDDIRYLVGKTDIAIVGSQLLKVLESEGLQGVKSFLQSISRIE
ncbi:tryptophan synthase subunit alpha [Paenibacillus sp. UNC451MF]|uniref:tryptophan synthase subunit alpha n=1 Tax=Paenibacillus sp. UNC451MF TaxID=1449063 RepID=UPI001E2A85C3|nr:tryptophan synthase subunit alpha [Paenibacillus sp. UNC451MF]